MPYALLADLVLAAHAAIVCFVVGGQLLILIGGWRRWRWVRRPGFRIAHLLLIGVIAGQSWFGALCPLTSWEMALREAAGEATYEVSFIEHWLSRLVYVEAPWWAFVTAYTAFAALVLASWWWVPPARSARDVGRQSVRD